MDGAADELGGALQAGAAVLDALDKVIHTLDGLVQDVRLLEGRELLRRRRGRRRGLLGQMLLLVLPQPLVDVGDGEVLRHVLLFDYGVALKVLIVLDRQAEDQDERKVKILASST